MIYEERNIDEDMISAALNHFNDENSKIFFSDIQKLIHRFKTMKRKIEMKSILRKIIILSYNINFIFLGTETFGPCYSMLTRLIFPCHFILIFTIHCSFLLIKLYFRIKPFEVNVLPLNLFLLKGRKRNDLPISEFKYAYVLRI